MDLAFVCKDNCDHIECRKVKALEEIAHCLGAIVERG